MSSGETANRLTAEQHAIVTTASPRVSVVAGAGTGKTRVLVERCLWLLDHGVSPRNLMVLTFTRKAAGELLTRISEKISSHYQRTRERDQVVAHMMVGTFHALALRILSAHGDRIGLDRRSLIVLDETEALDLLRSVARDLGFLHARSRRWTAGMSQRAVLDYRRQTDTGGDVQPHEGAAAVYEEYYRRLKQMNALDYGTLLARCLTLLTFHPGVLGGYRKQLRHVLVDEAQDMNMNQWRFVEIFSPPATLFLVGDERQSIYGFRGARPDRLLNRPKGDRPVREVGLRGCHRCAYTIVDAANGLMTASRECPRWPLISLVVRPGAAELATGRTEDIVDIIRGLVAQRGFRWGDIGVLSRTRRPLIRLGILLDGTEVPYRRIGQHMDIRDEPPFRHALTMLRWATKRDTPGDEALMEFFGFSRTEVLELRGPPGYRENFLRSRPKHPMTIRLQPFVDQASPTIADFFADDPAEVGRFWLTHCGDMTIADALEWYATIDLDAENAEGADAENHVALSTIHAAKGLEWAAVVILNCNEGSLPSSQSIRNGTVEEERRCMYVAITRARERLVLHYRRPRDQAAGREASPPSRFLHDCGLVVPELSAEVPL